MSHSRRTLSLVTVVLIFVLLAAGVVWRVVGGGLLSGDATEDAAPVGIALPEGDAAPQFSATVAQPVGGAEVIRDTLWIRVRAAGQAEAFRRTALTAQVEGIITRIPVRENDPVSAGTGLIQIDTIEHALGVAQARADLLAAETDYRQQILFDDADVGKPKAAALAMDDVALPKAEPQTAEPQTAEPQKTEPLKHRRVSAVEGDASEPEPAPVASTRMQHRDRACTCRCEASRHDVGCWRRIMQHCALVEV